MLNFARNQLIIPEKWGSEPCGKYKSPTFETANRRKTQKNRGLQIRFINREQNCSRRRLFTNCTPPYLTMFTILPDRGITKIAEIILVSAICGILPICSVIRGNYVYCLYIIDIQWITKPICVSMYHSVYHIWSID